MDIIEILVLVFLFGIPLLQQLLGRKSEEETSDPDVGVDEHPLPEPVPARIEKRPTTSSDWSADWGHWPEPDADVELPTTARSDRRLDEAPEPWTHLSEVERVEIPVVSLEPVEYDRDSYRRVRPRSVLEEPRAFARNRRVDAFVKNRDALREAVVVSEILGSPAALRPPFDRRTL